MRFARRYWLQLGGVVVALVLVGVLSLIAFRGSGSGGSSAVQTTTTRAATTPTPDPRVEQVKTAVRAYVSAQRESARTGNAEPVHAMTQPGSAADNVAGVTATISHTDHHNFITTRIDYQEASWRVDVAVSVASATVDVSFNGHDATWPALVPQEKDRETQVFHDSFELVLTESKWLITSAT